MSYLSIFIISFTIALGGALSPGPLLTTVIYESSKSGFKSGPLLILGHALLEILMLIFIIFGLSRFINNPWVLKTISLLGTIILFYFGLQILLSLPRLPIVIKDSPAKSKNLILTGATMSIANPYWSIWWLTIGLGLLLAAGRQGIMAVIVFFLGHILADLGWYSIVSLMISRGRRLISGKIYKGILACCGLYLIGFAIWFVLKPKT
ncbi:MAG: LysE family transporter [Candidatus Omnitrophota bacterium]